MQLQVLTDTVEYYHLIVDRVTDNRKHSTDEGLVDLEREGQHPLEHREQADNGEGVERQRNGRTYREGEVAEAEQDVEEDSDKGDTHADESAIGNILGYRRTYLRRTDDRTTLTDVGVLEVLDRSLAYQTVSLQSLVEHGLSLVVHGGAIRLYLIVGRDTDSLVVGTQREGAVGAAREGLVEDFANLLGLDRLLKLYHVVATTGEVDALVETAYTQACAEDYYSCTSDDEGELVHRHELEVGALYEVLGNRSPELEACPLVVVELTLVNQTCQEDSGEERAEDTDNPCGGEALDRTCTEGQQDDTSNQ